jgi:hypothetical protein
MDDFGTVYHIIKSPNFMSLIKISGEKIANFYEKLH